MGTKWMADEKRKLSQGTKLALEMGPLVVFFLANTYGEELAAAFPALKALGGKIFVGTAAFMVAMAISLTLTWIWERRLAVMPLITAVMVFIFGGLTLYLQDETFIKMKPTIVNILFGSALFIGLYVFGKPLLKLLFEGPFQLDDEGWTKLTFRWACFFFFLALANEVVWRNFSSDFWVNFKVWATMPMTIVFMLFQYPLIQRHSLETLEEEDSA
ncbi:septation protein A [Salaquimonas pukyongi]|uniref:septation protein A n=1 Tax=Salaquimonas pukyongi TaxID=2712698 RepID=UPI003D16990E